MLLHLLAFAAMLAAPTDADAPYIETFQHNGKTLLYLAALHHSAVKYPNALEDPVFKTISSVFAQNLPEAVIVEGVDPSELSGFLHYAADCAAAHYSREYCYEPALTAHLATLAGAEVYTGEPSARTQWEYFKAHGYSLQDYFGFLVMREIPHESERKRGQDNFWPLIEQMLEDQNRLLGTDLQFTQEDFAAWYAQHMQTPRNYLDLENEDMNPDPPPNEPKTLFHSMSALSEKARDTNILATIKAALEKHKRVLIVYGASHLTFEWNELLQLMGTPRKSKPF